MSLPTVPYYSHISYCFFLFVSCTSVALDTIPESRVPPTYSCYAFIPTTPSRPEHQHLRQSRTLTLFQHTQIQQKQQYMHHSYRNHRIQIGYQDNLIERPMMITRLHTPHTHMYPAVKREKSHSTSG